MMGKNKAPHAGEVDTLIGTNTIIEGNIKCGGTIRIDGTVNGDIAVKGDVIAGKTATIRGGINAENVEISGTVQGNIKAANVLKLYSSAKLVGDIEIHSFTTDEGALFQGGCNMVELPEDQNEVLQPPRRSNGKDKKHQSKDYLKSGIIDEL